MLGLGTPHRVQLIGSISSATLRYEQFEGSAYLVCPVVAMVGDSVVWPVNNDHPQFVPADVLAIAYEQWNNRPVCMNHPKSDGEYVSANSTSILESFSFGYTFNASISNNNLCLEAWLDTNKAKQVDGAQSIIDRLQANETVEISIGVITFTEDVSGTAPDGKQYKSRWMLAIADHLAMLEEGIIGACSVEMGCGALRVSMSADGKYHVHALTQARTPVYKGGTETDNWSAPSLSDYVKYLFKGANSDGPKSVAAMSSELKSDIANHTLLGDASASNFTGLTRFPCVNPANGKLNKKALQSILKASSSDDVSDQVLATCYEVARRLLNAEFGESESITVNTGENDMSVINDSGKSPGLFSRMLKSIGSLPGLLKASISNNTLRNKLTDAIMAVEPGLYWVEDYDHDKKTVVYVVRVVYGDEYYGGKVDMQCYQRSYSIDENETVTIGDERIEVEYQGIYVPVKDSAETEVVVTEAHSQECSCHKLSNHKEHAMMDAAKKTALIARLVASQSCPFTSNDIKALEAMSDDTLLKMDEAHGKTAPDKPTELGTIIDPDAKLAANTAIVPATPAAPTTPKTEAQWLAEAPEAVRRRYEADLRRENAVRTELVGKLVTASAFSKEKLETMDTEMLETLAATCNVTVGEPAADYSGRGVYVSPEITAASEARDLPDTWGLNKKAN